MKSQFSGLLPNVVAAAWGVFPELRRVRDTGPSNFGKVYRARSKYMPHQGKQECARRLARLEGK